MLDITTDIQSLTTFRRSSGDFIKHLKKSKRPMVLTVNGKAAAVVQDARLINGCSTLPPKLTPKKEFVRASKTKRREGSSP